MLGRWLLEKPIAGNYRQFTFLYLFWCVIFPIFYSGYMLLLNGGRDTEKNSKNGTITFFLRNNYSIMHCTVYSIEFQFYKTKKFIGKTKDIKLLSVFISGSVVHLIFFLCLSFLKEHITC